MVCACTAIAIATFIIWFDGNLTLALITTVGVLIIACPCALGQPPPLQSWSEQALAGNGILIKGAESLELAHKVQTIVLIKLARHPGKPTVADFVTVYGTANNELKLLRLAAAVERF